MDEYEDKQSYCGPSSLTVPRSWVSEEENRACYAHDASYGSLGPSSYVLYNAGDAKFISELGEAKEKTVTGRGARALFALKGAIAPHLVHSDKMYGPRKSFAMMQEDARIADIHRSGRSLKRNINRETVSRSRSRKRSKSNASLKRKFEPYARKNKRRKVIHRRRVHFAKPMVYGKRKFKRSRSRFRKIRGGR